jgi:Domain of unknown function (DUF3854)
MNAPISISQPTLAEFIDRTEREFIQGSAIAPDLYATATRIVSDTEQQFSEASYPIHEALNWRLTRFGHYARSTMYAVLLQQESGETWQAKLSTPRVDRKKSEKKGTTQYQKYETPVGNGSRAFLPPVNRATRRAIAQRYGCEVPPCGESFWGWLEQHPEIPIVLTEGGKKGLSLLSGGEVAIALYGVNGGSHKLLNDSRRIIPDLARFCQPSRRFTLAFDQDAERETRQRVNAAQRQMGLLLVQAGCEVKIAQWNGRDGKGIDDLIANQGWQAWERAKFEALSLTHWQIWQRLEQRLTYPATVKLTTADLSTLTLDNLPETGIIGIESSKGTGKTKYTQSLIQGVEKVLAGGHRVALMRNLSYRLGLDYKGDLDKVQGKFITGAGYTLRIGFCVDSLLWFNPNDFAGCDLVLDEVVQVIRHLLTSSTCAKEGKRPALLARLRELVRVARRVIVADADLDNATLHYLRELRGTDEPVFLIRNAYKPQGYDVRFIQSPDRSTITAGLLNDIETLESGKLFYVPTDSLATSESLARLIQQKYPNKRILVVNSRTSGDDEQQEFMQKPDTVLDRYDIIICSPSVATGVSIEAQGIVQRVYGIFSGVSSTDPDIAQSLDRVREPVQRVVWCAKSGSNYSKVSRSLNPLELKGHLQALSSTTVSLIRSSLREDLTGQFQSYDWQADPHVNLYCKLAADQNFAMRYLREAVLVRLRFEGHRVTVEDWQANPAAKLLLQQAKQELRQINAEASFGAEDLTYAEIMALEQKERLEPDEQLAVAKYYLKDFYCLETLTIEDVLRDNEGRWRGALLNLESQLFPGLAADRTVKALEKQAGWNQGLCPWDISNAELRRQLRAKLGLEELIKKAIEGWTWTKYDLAESAAKARAYAREIKVALHLTIDKMSDTQIVHQLLSQLGIKLAFHWSRVVPGHEGEKLRVHSLNTDHWEMVWGVLSRRTLKRQQIQKQQQTEAIEILSERGSPVSFKFLSSMGDPAIEAVPELDSEASKWLSEECLEDARQMIEAAEGDADLRAQIQQMIPAFVFEYLERNTA